VKTNRPLGGKELVDTIVKAAQEKLAENIILIDLRGLHGAAEWFILCQGDSTVHTRAIGDGIRESLREQETTAWHHEGDEDGRWVLIDYSDVVVHIMIPEVRDYYDLESLWEKSRQVQVD
jgi:ribosome-associated protein